LLNKENKVSYNNYHVGTIRMSFLSIRRYSWHIYFRTRTLFIQLYLASSDSFRMVKSKLRNFALTNSAYRWYPFEQEIGSTRSAHHEMQNRGLTACWKKWPSAKIFIWKIRNNLCVPQWLYKKIENLRNGNWQTITLSFRIILMLIKSTNLVRHAQFLLQSTFKKFNWNLFIARFSLRW